MCFHWLHGRCGSIRAPVLCQLLLFSYTHCNKQVYCLLLTKQMLSYDEAYQFLLEISFPSAVLSGKILAASQTSHFQN